MPDDPRARTALAHLGLVARAAANGASGAGVVLSERPLRRQVAVRGDAGEPAFVEALASAGVPLPRTPNTVEGPDDLRSGPRTLWLGPDEWLVVANDDADPLILLRTALGRLHAAVADVSDSRAVLALSGASARDVLAKGCPLDLHPRAFGPGRCAQSHLGKAHVLIHQIDAAPLFEIYVHRSFADYLWRWLDDAAADYAPAVTISE